MCPQIIIMWTLIFPAHTNNFVLYTNTSFFLSQPTPIIMSYTNSCLLARPAYCTCFSNSMALWPKLVFFISGGGRGKEGHSPSLLNPVHTTQTHYKTSSLRSASHNYNYVHVVLIFHYLSIYTSNFQCIYFQFSNVTV